MAAKDELGKAGEEVAAKFLEKKGLLVMSRNWRCSEGEIDIVATDGLSRVIFCEVKTRSGTGYGSPAETVTAGKRRKLRRLAQVWLQNSHSGWLHVRFDVIGVLWLEGQEPDVNHIDAAF